MNSRTRAVFVARLTAYWSLALLTFSGAVVAQTPPPSAVVAPDTVDKDYAPELPRFAPLSPEQALKSFDVLPGFRFELVAAEPLVFDPIAFAFDAHQRLFVVEMLDYSEQETEHLGRVALLEDTDADGRMDKRTTFVDGLSWPTAIWPWRDGVLVAEPPRITWYRDTNDDGRSDQSEDWFTGFGRSNVQGLVNSFRWGVDGYLHGATSSSGAEVQQLDVERGPLIELRRRDFAIDPLTHALLPEAGGGQHGLSFNRWGDKFVTSNSDHLQQILGIDNWLAKHGSRLPLPSVRRSIAADGPQAEVYRASPVEPWRIVRTRLRVSGVAPGIVEGGGRAAGYFTGATGTWIMDSEAGFGEANVDTALVCDVGSNLVHRKRLIDHGLFWSGQRVDKQTELLRSKDTWFRPVQLGDGPDGGLYIADMYREVIEHPKSLPPMIKRHLDLTSGRDRGRIWRLIPDTTATSATRHSQAEQRTPAELEARELVSRLSHPVAWQRRTCSQLLLERQAVEVAKELRAKAVDQASPEAQVLAMHVANRLGLFSAEMGRQLLSTEHERVLAHAVRLIRENDLATPAADDLLKIADSNLPRVQLELAMAASDLDTELRQPLLTKLFVHAREPIVQAVLATVAGESSWQLFDLAASAMSAKTQASWLQLLLPQWSQQISANPGLRSAIADRVLHATETQDFEWLTALSQLDDAAGVARIMDTLSADQRPHLDAAIQSQLEAALEAKSNSEAHFRIARLLSPDVQSMLAERLLAPTNTEAAQRAAIDLIAWRRDSQFAEPLMSKFASLTPSLQADCLRALVASKTTLPWLVEAIEQQTIQASQVPLDIREQLFRVGDSQLAGRMKILFSQISPDRQAVIERYLPALDASEKAAALSLGQEVFQKNCQQCHRLGNIGNDVGPPLRQLSDKSPEQLLATILDPNREIDPRYVSYSILLADGRIVAGIIEDESADQLIVKEAGGKRHAIRRAEIEQIKNNGVSLMPVGLEESITPAQMSQLIHFLKSATVVLP